MTMTTIEMQGAAGATATLSTDASASASATPTTLLPDPVDALIASGDPAAELAALTVRTGMAQRHVARALRDAEEAVAEREADAQVQAMHDKASSMRTQAWFDGAMTLGEQVAGSGSTVGCVLSAGQKLGDGLFAADQQDADASAGGHEAAAAHAKNAAGNANDAFTDANDCIRAALQFYGEYVSTRAQTLGAALHRT
jgi:hypothetical protein